MKIRTLIVDDEELARLRVRELLLQEADIEIVGECGDGEEALHMISEHSPDLLFLDIQMPEMDGFQLLERLTPEATPTIVFVTAYDEFALRAFEAHAFDYLLKPFHGERFRATLARVRAHLTRPRGGISADERLYSLLESLQSRRTWMERFVVRSGARIHFVRADEVDWMEAEGNYVRLHTGDKSHLLRTTVSSLIERLNPERFLRVHRSIIINLDRLYEVQTYAKGSYILVLKDGTKLTSSATYRDGVERLISDRM